MSTSKKETDKKTIGLTSTTEDVFDILITQRGWFDDKIDAARFSMAYAIKLNIQPGTVEGAGTTWNIGSFDPDSELRSLIPVLYPNVRMPYRTVEYLVNKGAELIGDKLDENHFLEPIDLL